MIHTASDLSALIGRPALLECGALHVLVTVRDARQVFHRVDCLVEPQAGTGRQWVSVERLTEPATVYGLTTI